MKYLLFVITIALLVGCKREEPDFGLKCIPMPEEYRKITGYDSIELITCHEKTIEANFCCPNQWEFDKFKMDTIYIHDTIGIAGVVKPKRKTSITWGWQMFNPNAVGVLDTTNILYDSWPSNIDTSIFILTGDSVHLKKDTCQLHQ